jgi:glycine/D-amino acid oxidase-like deaminating enzyme
VQQAIHTEVGVIGGGVAGLWTLNRLAAAGIDARLVEPRALGTGQSIAAQGIIHGGIKYTLAGTLTGASEAIQRMPARWRASLAGKDPVDLRGLEPVCEHYFMWSNGGLRGRLGSFLASQALRGRVDRLEPADYPPFFRDPAFTGQLYRLEDFVVDSGELIARLAANVASSILQAEVTAATASAAQLEALTLTGPGGTRTLRAKHWVFTAGVGNEKLLALVGATGPAMQRRPLRQVLVRLRWPHPLFAHCITDITRPEPRLTVTSHPVGPGEWIWYIGGSVATSAPPDAASQIESLRQECARVLPWVPLDGARFSTIAVDRAEARQSSGLRPDEAYVARADALDNVLVGWPTKLTLAPDLGDRVLAALQPGSAAPNAEARGQSPSPDGAAETPPVAAPVWDELLR